MGLWMYFLLRYGHGVSHQLLGLNVRVDLYSSEKQRPPGNDVLLGWRVTY
jgi:hypothetical protein